jgi:MFS family permease
MFILPVMEDHGTRPGYLLAYALFIGFVIPQPLVTGYAAFCGVRFLAGCAAGVLQTCMDGVIADVWADDVKMSRPVSCYVAALLVGVSSGPVMGGVVSGVGGLGWRWILWVQLIVYVVLVVPVWFLFGETRVAVIMGKVERRERKDGIDNVSGTVSSMIEEQRITTQPQPIEDAHSHSNPRSSVIAFLRGNIMRPFHLLLTEPVVFSFTLLSALSYGITFLSTQSIPQVYSATYALSEPQTAYIQSAIVLGEITGWAICIWIQDPFFAREAQRAAADSDGTGRLRRSLPEKRLYAAVPGSFLALAAGLLVYGFTSRPAISLYLPTFGVFLIGIGVVVVMQAIMMYVTDSYGSYAASASAAVCFGENVFAAFLPLGSQGMYARLGFGWASGLLGFVALLLGLGPVVLVFYGERVRARSRFMGERATGEG